MDLFDVLASTEAADAPRHMLMPNMRLACGRDMLTCPQPWVMSEDATTCTECHAAAEPHGGISAWCSAMSRRQARVAG